MSAICLPYVGGLVIAERFYAEIRSQKMKYIDAVEFVRRRQGVRE
jgi:hypothetical protein